MRAKVIKGKVKKSKKIESQYEIKYFRLTNFLEDNYPDVLDEYEGGYNGKKKDSEEGQE